MDKKIDKALEYYKFQSHKIAAIVNKSTELSIEEIIEYGDELAVLESKITALEVAKEN
tara:strand:- start:286693 stop:286866 length:174 start_codon:yes stop_codon:yes gene_type:complete